MFDAPLSFAQQRLWFLSQMEGVSEAYHIALGLRLRGELDSGALRRALDALVSRHETLRTTFAVVGGNPVQRIGPVQSGFWLVEHDLRAHADGAEELAKLRLEEATAAFDLESGPLIRGRLIALDDREHVLLITMHHIVSDGWSMGVLFRELSALYRGYHDDAPVALPALDIQYADYAAWQRDYLSGAVLQEQVRYWKETLAGIPEVHRLPTDRPRPAQQDHAGDYVRVEFDAELTRKLRVLSRAHGTTLFTTLLTAWGLLLGRLSGDDDVVIGAPVANRRRPEIEGLIGFFVNTLVLRLDLSGKPSVAELLDRVKAQTLAAQDRQDVPFEQVVEVVQPPRSLAHTPLFQVVFAWQNNDPGEAALPGLQVSGVGAPVAVAQFDLTLNLAGAGDRIVGGILYAAALFDRVTVERYVGYLRTLLEAMVAGESRSIAELAMLSAGERRQIVVDWNAMATAYPPDRCIHELFEKQVVIAPDAVAVVHEGTQLTYGELNAQANSLARHLRNLGVVPDSRVALCVDRSPEMIIGLLAVLKAGGAYVPLDPSYPVERLQYLLEDSAPVAVLTRGAVSLAVQEMLRASGAAVIDLQRDTSRWAGESASDLDRSGLMPEHLAYVIYTSGTTGHPKGVMIEHGNVARLFAATQGWFHFDRRDVWALFHSIAFDFSVWEIWGALAHGGRLVVVPQLTTRSPREFYELICAQGVTILNQTPSAFRQLIEAQADSPAAHQLREVIFGGEALDASMLSPWFERAGNKRVRLVNMYGITETTVHVTYRPIEPQDALRPGGSAIGRRLPDLRIYIVDQAHEPVPIGVAGELYVGGAGVARGYLNRPELTAERFIPSPFVAGDRLYKTGDLGRYLPDGTIEYVGRNDFQVKIRGFRIELGEIEARLRDHASIRDAVVLAREDVPGEKRLVAYYTSREAGGVGVEELRSHVLNALPEHMVPAAYVALEALPLTPNGKLDRKALPVPDSSAYVARRYEAPVGEVEQTIARIWGEVLEVERVGRHDNFFELGGHSLLAVRVLSLMREAGVHSDIRTLFNAPTLMTLAGAVRETSEIVEAPPNGIAPGSPTISPEMLPLVRLSDAEIGRIVETVPGGALNVQDIYPLAPLQEGILFHHLLAREGDPYLQRAVQRFDTRVHLDGFLAAMQAVIDRHDILRTAFVWEGLREPVQVVWRQAHLPVEEVTCDLAAGGVVEQLKARFDPRHYRIDVQQAPLFRVAVAHDSASDRWIMILLFHHLVDDQTSLKTLFNEIKAHLLDVQAELPRPVPFRNFVAQARFGVSREEHEAFFRAMLGDVDEPTTPFGLADAQGDGSGIAQARRALDSSLSKRLREHARVLGVSTASICHLAWARVLGALSGRDDVVFGTVLFGRMLGSGSDRTLGLLINTLPLRIRVGDRGVKTSVRETHDALARLMHHEHASLALAQRCSAVVAPTPLFSTLLNYRHIRALNSANEVKGAWKGIEFLGSEERTNYPLTLSVDDFGDGLRLTAQTVSSVDPARVCGYMQTALEQLVHALDRAPAKPVRELNVLSESERRRILVDWNATEAPFPSDRCVHELIEEQAAIAPDAVAVVYEAAQLTYGELNEQANSLARYLRSTGVVPDTRIALCVERSLEMMVGLLAVLKAGGAYVPLDPRYPIDRLQYMLHDSAPLLVLTHGAVSGPVQAMLRASSVAVIDLQDDASRWAGEPASNLDRSGLGPEHLACVIYTSGSTGLPKGVMIEHRGVCNITTAQAQRFSIDAGSRILQFSSFSFDGFVAEMTQAFCQGASLYMPGRRTILAGRALVEIVERYQISHATLPPAVLSDLPLDARLEPIEILIAAGDRLAGELVRRWAPGRRLINGYGPTEATIGAAMHYCDASDPGDPPIGRPFPNARVYILDETREPVAIGVAGELYIGGAGVARGYLNRPELTAERFVPSPFVAGDRLYKTGDLARYLPDGTIEFLGRNDFQVKIRGFRIELGEVEARLRDHALIRDVVVIAREDVSGEKRLVAYYTSHDAGKVSVEELRSYVLEVLPEHMVPAAYVCIEAFPQTPNGKLDRKALPAPESDAYVVRRYEAPSGEVEQTIARIWSEVLKVERVGRHDNFFELGGHSLLAVRALSRMRQELEVELGLTDVFTSPVLRELAQAVRGATVSELPAMTAVGRDRPLGLSFAQQRLWFLSQMDRASEAYHIPLGLHLRGVLDSDALRRALDALVSRHESLRTTFSVVDGDPVQRIGPVQSGFWLVEHDLRADEDRAEELAKLRLEEATAAFHLESGPLIRGRLIALGDNEHVLLVTMHHIVSDGWSMGILLRELSALYRGYHENAPVTLPALDIQYADYAAWQREHLRGAVLQEQLGYWKKALEGIPEVHHLPTDRPRPARQDHAGEYVRVELDAELSAKLRALSLAHGTTLFTTMLTAWGLLLGRLSRDEDVVIGTPVANRGRTEIEGLIGFFINTLVLRLDLAGDPSVGELLDRVKAQTLAAQDRQDVPFEQVVDAVQPPRSLAHAPLFQVMFAWQNNERGDVTFPDLQVSRTGTAVTVAQFDLTLNLGEVGDRIAGGIVYDTALFDRVTVERYAGYLRTLLEAMAAGEAQSVARLAMLSDGERRQVLADWNATEAAFPSDRCVHELFEAQVAIAPEAVAVAYEGAQLTYGELEAQANRLARYLRSIGVVPDTRVALCVERSLEMMVALLAVLKAGGAYVPLDPSYPPDRLQYMLADSAPVAVLTHGAVSGAVQEMLHASGVAVVDLQRDASRWSGESASNVDRSGLIPEHLAYVIYTSGTTGRPKGVMNEHRAVVNRLHWTQAAYELGPDDRVLHKTPFSFDVSVWELFWPLLSGARVVMARPEGHKDPDYLGKIIDEQQISTLHFVPSMLRTFLDHMVPGSCSSLRHVICSGEALSGNLARLFQERLPGADLSNLYGPTEAAIDVTAWDCQADVLPENIPIGRPIWNARIYILDDFGEPVPIGVSGELHIGGVPVARGYLNHPELTAELFIPSPFVAGDRLYKTGDLARYLPDGTIEYLGRNDFQVKIRGFRIELGEIEARLRAHGSVRDVVVLAREDNSGEKRLVAYYTSREAGAGSAEEFRSYLLAVLPEYMVPAAYVVLEALPLTPNGKLDRKALPAPESDAYVVRRYEAPLGAIEQALARIWSEMLELEAIGRHDNFFELGGHSLAVVRMLSRLRQEVEVELSLTQVFASPILRELAEVARGATASKLPAMTRIDRGGPLVLSFAQQRLWFLSQLQGVSEAYHIPLGLHLRGELDRGALRRALDALVSRHESLRTTFSVVDGKPVQRIGSAQSGFSLAEHDLRAHADGAEELAKLRLEEATAAFDLESGPLIRGRLVVLDDREHVLLITMHHIVSDGWSMGILLRELSALYRAYHENAPAMLPALDIQYADYAAWQRAHLSDAVLQEQLGYWKQALAGIPEAHRLPADRPRPAHQDHTGAFVRVELDAELTGKLRALSRAHGTTLFTTLLTAWGLLLGRLSGDDDVVIGTPVANRRRPEIEGLIGFFVNTLVLRLDLSGTPSVGELLDRVKARTLAAQDRQDVPFEQVVEVVQPPRSLAHTPLFQVLFAWQNHERGETALPELQVSGVGAAVAVAQFDLTLNLGEAGDRIVGGIVYATALFDRVTIERYGGYLRTVLEGMVAGEAQSVARIAMLSGEERRQIVVDWNATATTTTFPSGRCIHELLEEQVAIAPDAVAVVYEGTQLTYGELNAQANRLARYLRSIGVVPDSRVALCVERSLEMMVGILAVLKAGGAYVPLDPSYPVDRLRYMLEDSAPVAVLTHGLVSGAVREMLRASDVEVIDVQADASLWAGASASNVDRSGLMPEHLAYVIYTSGTTGHPKGVMVEHRNVARLFAATEAWFHFDRRDVWMLLHSFAFDFSVWEIWGALLHGGSLVIVPHMTTRSPRELYELLCARDVTIINQTPSAFRQLMEAQTDSREAHRLREVIFGGEALDPAMLSPWFTRAGNKHVRLVNMYGITETTVHVTYQPIGPEDVLRTGGSAIGRRIPDLRVYILDESHEPAPIGVAGELYVGGAGVARGYLNRPELTAERFLPSPFVAGDRLYKTGDRARYLRDGTIEYLGRNDFQVKVRGFRIELGEIEERLRDHAMIRDAVVLAREDVPGEKRLVAYCTSRAASGVSAEELRSHLTEALPEYMIPAAYVVLEALPLTPNGKLDRAALPAPESDAYVVRRYEAPLGEVEETIARIWREVLEIERVGRHDNFFELGGHSLLAVRVLSLMREAGLYIDVQLFYKVQTLTGLGAMTKQLAEIRL